jgi:hypothetical protein
MPEIQLTSWQIEALLKLISAKRKTVKTQNFWINIEKALAPDGMESVVEHNKELLRQWK